MFSGDYRFPITNTRFSSVSKRKRLIIVYFLVFQQYRSQKRTATILPVLLKLAESSARIAASLLADAESEHRAAAKASPSATPATPGCGVSRSAKRRAKKKVSSAMDLDPHVEVVSGIVEAVSAVPAAGSKGLRGASHTGSYDRAMEAKSPHERSPRLGAAGPFGSAYTADSIGGSASSTGHFPDGSVVLIGKLQSRSELEHKRGMVISWHGPSGRYCVEVELSGECVRLKAESIQLAVFSANFQRATKT